MSRRSTVLDLAGGQLRAASLGRLPDVDRGVRLRRGQRAHGVFRAAFRDPDLRVHRQVGQQLHATGGPAQRQAVDLLRPAQTEQKLDRSLTGAAVGGKEIADDPAFADSDRYRVLLGFVVPSRTSAVTLAYGTARLTASPIALDGDE